MILNWDTNYIDYNKLLRILEFTPSPSQAIRNVPFLRPAIDGK